jgi:CheY-like chemotaxis protein
MIKGEPLIIMLVEDDMGHAEIVRRNFEDCRVANRIVHITDGQAVLDYLYRKNGYADTVAYPMPNIILLDLRLPKVDGLEVLRRIKADEHLLQIPVVVLTTSEAESDRTKAYGYGANSYLVKPVSFEKFSLQLEAFGFYWMAWNRLSD